MSKILIVGSGITGCTAALELAQQGHTVSVIESENTIGGKVLSYCCKATDECSRCGVCVAHNTIAEALKHPRISIIGGASILNVRNTGKKISVGIEQSHPAISYKKCITCDACLEVCPTKCITKYDRGGLIEYAIDYFKCLRHSGKQCNKCISACPVSAISGRSKVGALSVIADVVIVATGHRAYDAFHKPALGYGRLDGVITGEDAEEILSRQTYLGSPSEDIAFVQCVGSRDPQGGRNYCSRVCCAYAVRMAKALKYRNPDSKATIYFIDLQNFDKAFSCVRRGLVEQGVKLVRAVPFSIDRNGKGKLRLKIEGSDGTRSIAEHDKVVLSVGMGPAPDSGHVADLFGLEQDEYGFFNSSVPNIFVAGTCAEPQSINDSIASARSVAAEIVKMFPSGNRFEKAKVSRGVKIKKVPLCQSVLVIGGGIAGAQTARELKNYGYKITLIECSDKVGGQCQPTPSPSKEGNLISRSSKEGNKREEIPSKGGTHPGLRPPLWGRGLPQENSPLGRGLGLVPVDFARLLSGVNVVTGARLTKLSGSVGSFTARVEMSSGVKDIECGSVVVCSGTDMTEVGKGIFDFDRVLNIADVKMAMARFSDKDRPRCVGLVLDMNVEETKAGTEMALECALHLREKYRCEVFVFCREVRVDAKHLENLYDTARNAGINIVKYDGDIHLESSENEVLISARDCLLDKEVTVTCHIVGVSPYGLGSFADAHLIDVLGIGRDSLGQMQDNNIHLFPELTNRPGIFVVGACRGQYYLPEVVNEAKVAALRVHSLLSQKHMVVELSNAIVDANKCALCLACMRTCPHGAMVLDMEKRATVSIPEVCQKCGVCVGECPAGAIELPVINGVESRPRLRRPPSRRSGASRATPEPATARRVASREGRRLRRGEE